MPAASDRVLLDPAAAHPELSTLRSALTAQDWRAGRAVLDAATPAGRSWLLRWAAEDRGLDHLLRQVLQQDPNDSTAAALLALTWIDFAWEIRGRGPARGVTPEQHTHFQTWLRHAEAVLIDAAARRPADPAVWLGRLMTSRGLQLGLAETHRRYARLAAAAPDDLAGQAQYLQNLCPKWGGNWDLLHSWAWTTAQAAPPGAPQGALVAEAHLEHWLDLTSQDGPAGRAYLMSPPVRETLDQSAQRSIWHPDFRREPGWVPAVCAYAMVFGLIGEQDAAGAAFALLGDLASRRPWDYLGPDVTATVRARRRQATALTGGGR